VITTAAGNELDARIAGQGRVMGTVEIDDALAQGIARDLVAGADEAQADDGCAIAIGLWHDALTLIFRSVQSPLPPPQGGRAFSPRLMRGPPWSVGTRSRGRRTANHRRRV